MEFLPNKEMTLFASNCLLIVLASMPALTAAIPTNGTYLAPSINASTIISAIDYLFPPINRSSPLPDTNQLAGLLVKRCPTLVTNNRPVDRYHKAVEATAKFQLIKFEGVEETLEQFTVYGYLEIRWPVTTCARWDHDPAWSAIGRLTVGDFLDHVPFHRLPFWRPVVWQPNNAENVFAPSDFAGKQNFATFYIEKTGHAGMVAPGKFVSHCDLAADVAQFPFDTVQCSIVFQSWLPINLVNFTNGGFQADRDEKGHTVLLPSNFMSKASVWSLKSAHHSEEKVIYGRDEFAVFRYEFVLKRIPSAFILDMVAPALSLFALLLASFYIPARHPERPGISLTIVVNFFLLRSIVDERLPQSSQPMMISVYFLGLLYLGTLITIYFCITNHIAHKEMWNATVYKSPRFGHITLIVFLDLLTFTIALLLTISLHAFIFLKMVAGTQ